MTFAGTNKNFSELPRSPVYHSDDRAATLGQNSAPSVAEEVTTHKLFYMLVFWPFDTKPHVCEVTLWFDQREFKWVFSHSPFLTSPHQMTRKANTMIKVSTCVFKQVPILVRVNCGMHESGFCWELWQVHFFLPFMWSFTKFFPPGTISLLRNPWENTTTE